MSSDVEWNIRPEGFLAEVGWPFRRRSSWLDVKVCPFCQGGDHRDTHTFAVHATDGNFICLRASCGAGGSFWKLIETAGRNPRDYLEGGRRKAEGGRKKRKRKRFVYGR